MINPSVYVLPVFIISPYVLCYNLISCTGKIQKMKKGEIRADKNAFKKNAVVLLTVLISEIITVSIASYAQGTLFRERIILACAMLLGSVLHPVKGLSLLGHCLVALQVRKMCTIRDGSD